MIEGLTVLPRLGLATLCLFAVSVAADDRAPLPGESAAAARRLDELARKEKAVRDDPSEAGWAAVVTELQAVLSAHGDDLVPAADGLSVAARWVCHARLARLDAAG